MDHTMLSMADAAMLCKVSKPTISRWRKAGKIPGAFRLDPTDEGSPWMIPRGALFEAGLAAEQQRSTVAAQPPADAAEDSREVQELRAALKAAERERDQTRKDLDTLQDLFASTIKALGAGEPSEASAPAPAQTGFLARFKRR
jgi:hypothetical protein